MSARQRLPLVALQVAGGELLHQPVDLLRLAGEPEALQEGPESRDKVPPTEVQLVHVAVHHLLVELDVLAQELPHLGLWVRRKEDLKSMNTELR